MFCTIKFVYYKSFCVRDDIGSYIRTVYHMVSHTPKRGVGSSNLFWDAKTGRLVRRSEGAFHKPSAFYPAQDDAGGATAFGHQSIAHGCAPYAMK